MPTCPICFTPLETSRQREGLYYPCRSCEGRAVTVSQVRHVLGERLATKLLGLMKLSLRQGERRCPFCAAFMHVIQTEEPLLELDVCRTCSAVWFDAPTYESLPQLTSDTANSRPMQVTELIALDRLKELKEKIEEEHKQARKKKPLHRNKGLDKDDNRAL